MIPRDFKVLVIDDEANHAEALAEKLAAMAEQPAISPVIAPLWLMAGKAAVTGVFRGRQ